MKKEQTKAQNKVEIQKITIDECVFHYKFNIYFIQKKEKLFKNLMQTCSITISNSNIQNT
jgi:hypothetical protein